MPAINIYSETIFEDTSLTVMARIKGNAGTNITQASLSSITCRSYDSSDTLVVSPTVTISSSVFDTLQTEDDDPRWTKDSTGYNFAFTIPAAAFPSPQLYRVEFKFTPAVGDPFFLVLRVNAQDILQS